MRLSSGGSIRYQMGIDTNYLISLPSSDDWFLYYFCLRLSINQYSRHNLWQSLYTTGTSLVLSRESLLCDLGKQAMKRMHPSLTELSCRCWLSVIRLFQYLSGDMFMHNIDKFLAPPRWYRKIFLFFAMENWNFYRVRRCNDERLFKLLFFLLVCSCSHINFRFQIFWDNWASFILI